LGTELNNDQFFTRIYIHKLAKDSGCRIGPFVNFPFFRFRKPPHITIIVRKFMTGKEDGNFRGLGRISHPSFRQQFVFADLAFAQDE